MPQDVILHAAKLSRGNPSAIAYMNGILSAWQRAGITTLAQATEYKVTTQKSDTNAVAVTKTYTSEQLNSMFANLEYEDL
jgi:DNA replication protein DnaD